MKNSEFSFILACDRINVNQHMVRAS